MVCFPSDATKRYIPVHRQWTVDEKETVIASLGAYYVKQLNFVWPLVCCSSSPAAPIMPVCLYSVVAGIDLDDDDDDNNGDDGDDDDKDVHDNQDNDSGNLRSAPPFNNGLYCLCCQCHESDDSITTQMHRWAVHVSVLSAGLEMKTVSPTA